MCECALVQCAQRHYLKRETTTTTKTKKYALDPVALHWARFMAHNYCSHFVFFSSLCFIVFVCMCVVTRIGWKSQHKAHNSDLCDHFGT